MQVPTAMLQTKAAQDWSLHMLAQQCEQTSAYPLQVASNLCFGKLFVVFRHGQARAMEVPATMLQGYTW